MYKLPLLKKKVSAHVILGMNHIAALLTPRQDFPWVRGACFSVHNYYLNLLQKKHLEKAII